MRRLALAALLAAALLAAAAASAVAPSAGCGCAHHGDHHGHHHGHHHGVRHHGGWMRRPFSFDGEFEGDGSCEVHREGDKGSMSGRDECEKNLRGRLRLERERGGRDGPNKPSEEDSVPLTRLTPASRAALGAGIAGRIASDASSDAPPGFLEAFVADAMAEVAPEDVDAAVTQRGRELRIKANARFSLECACSAACACACARP